MKIKPIFLLFFIFFIPFTIFGQSHSTEFLNIVRIIKQNEPDWRLEQESEISDELLHDSNEKNALSRIILQSWKSKKDHVSFLLFVFQNKETANKALISLRKNGLGLSKRRTILETSLPQLSIEGFSWSNEFTGEKGISFINGNTVVNLGSSSLENAKRFTKYILESAKTSN